MECAVINTKKMAFKMMCVVQKKAVAAINATADALQLCDEILKSLASRTKTVTPLLTMESTYNMDGTAIVGMTVDAHTLDGGRNDSACTPDRRQSFFKPVGISRQCDLGGGSFHRASPISRPFVPTAFTPPPSPFDSSKMILLKTPSSVRTVATVATTPESIASCASYLSAASSSFCMTTPTMSKNVLQENFLKDSLASVVDTPPTKQSLVKRKKMTKSQSRFDRQRQPIDDFARKQKQKQKAKTELCMYYLSNRNLSIWFKLLLCSRGERVTDDSTNGLTTQWVD
ncbi:hypothetical protein FRACYDRAFT_234397 [Fragilariopsis cylindrus CCMP1102]|uniref:Uncharacterized protein n=1 Tax=Fragilariopsis cylindrus CCMP1102 TaxID=635003 RepID=A0A1E7FRN7_9STRA|nr:hypothetical protein FRACYDRAFT_234397 [Fragilariopsis cylindrus CCMP1102]|eukprot:OEU20765.1 hypothetical protein FRACYDRAFT_234397 [Fragilariopsis cylindrus CCMP1102]